MAFATSNLARESSGTANLMRGSWSGVSGDSYGTITGSGFALTATVMTNNTSGPENAIPCRISNSSGTWTVTIPYQSTVTGGTFEVKFK